MEKQEDMAKGYHYTDCGLDYIYLVNGFEVIEHAELGKCVSIRNTDNLHRLIMKLIIERVLHIRGQEIRFIRSFLRLNQTQMGVLMKKGIRTIQRWEKEDRNKPIPASLDRFLRLFLAAYLDKDEITHQVCEMLKEIKEDHPKSAKLKNEYTSLTEVELVETSQGWKTAA